MVLIGAIFAQFASAAAEIQGLTGNQVSINNGDSFKVSFSINNNNPAGDYKNLTNIEIDLPQLSSGSISLPGNWSSAKLGNQETFTISNNKVSLTGLTILNESSAGPIELTFTTQKGAVQGLYIGDISFTAKFQDGTTLVGAVIPPIHVAVTIPSASSLGIFVSNSISLSQNVSYITLNNTGNTILNNILLNTSGNLNFTLSQTNIPLLDIGKTSSPIRATTDLSLLRFGTNTGTITATAQDGTSTSSSLSVTKTFCSSGQKTSNLTIDSVDITEFGDDETDWRLLDEITFEVEIKNSGSQEVDDVVAEIGLFDSEGNNVVGDLTFSGDNDESADLGAIDSRDRGTATFTFQVPADMNLGDYKLAIKAYSDYEGEDNMCVDTARDFGSNSFYRPIKISSETDDGKQIAFDNIRLTPTTEATCGDTITLTFDVVNIGDKDQDQVKVTLANAELNIAQSLEIKNNLNKGDKETNQKFTFTVPQGLQNKEYKLELSAEYGYSKSRGEYSDSLDNPYEISLNVIGCNAQTEASLAQIDVAPLSNEAVAGQDIAVTSIIKNIGTQSNIYVVGATGFESWATLKSASDRIITLAPGESKQVDMTFTINSDASGSKTFSIQTIANGKTDSKTISVQIASGNSSFSGFSLGGSTLLWIVGIVNVILLVLIIIIAIRISRR